MLLSLRIFASGVFSINDDGVLNFSVVDGDFDIIEFYVYGVDRFGVDSLVEERIFFSVDSEYAFRLSPELFVEISM